MTGSFGWRDWIIPAVDHPEESVPVPAGLYHFHRDRDGQHIRYHLRVDHHGPAILLAGASEAVVLSPAGAAIARAWLEGATLAELEGRYATQVGSESVQDLARALEDLGRTSVRYPVFNLVDPASQERTWQLSAPLQADVELGSTSVAERVIDRLWQAGIPHVRWVVTPRCDRQGVVAMVRHTEDVGMIAGVRAPSVRWFRPETLQPLAEVGLDYVVFPWGVLPQVHDTWFGHGDMQRAEDVISQIRSWEMTPVATLPLIPFLMPHVPESLDRLQEWGVDHVEVFAVAETSVPVAGLPRERQRPGRDGGTSTDLEDALTRGFWGRQLRQLAGWVEDLADSRRLQLVWLPPHARWPGEDCRTTVRRGPRTSGDVAIHVDAVGNVIPPRGPLRSAGNVLIDPWESIWNDPAFRRFRKRVTSNTRCTECPGMAICAADCPAEIASWVLPP